MKNFIEMLRKASNRITNDNAPGRPALNADQGLQIQVNKEKIVFSCLLRDSLGSCR